MSITIGIEATYNNNKTVTLSGAHISKGYDYITAEDMQELENRLFASYKANDKLLDIKKLELKYNACATSTFGGHSTINRRNIAEEIKHTVWYLTKLIGV